MENSTNNTTLIVNRSNFNPILVGVIYIVLAICLSTLYLLTLAVMIADKSKLKHCYYKIMLSIGLADVVQILILGLAGGTFTLCQKSPFVVNKIFGGILNGCWFSYSLSCHLLGFNRFITMYFGTVKSRSIFSPSRTKLYMGLIWIYGISWMILNQIPDFNFIYFLEMNIFFYDDTNLSQIVSKFDGYSDLFNLICMIMWYMLIYIYLKLKVSFFPSIII